MVRRSVRAHYALERLKAVNCAPMPTDEVESVLAISAAVRIVGRIQMTVKGCPHFEVWSKMQPLGI